MTAPAASAVFNTVELAEAILANVDVKTLLISCQRTCKNWRDVIADSVTLQEKLFFKARSDGDLVFNPLAIPDMKILIRSPSANSAVGGGPERREAFKTWSLGSFGRMLICQPPTAEAIVYLENTSTIERRMRISVREKKGVTIGSVIRDLKENISDWKRDDEESRYCEHWAGNIACVEQSDGEWMDTP